MENVRKAIDKVLDRARQDMKPSKQTDFAEAFALFLRSQGIETEANGKRFISHLSHIPQKCFLQWLFFLNKIDRVGDERIDIDNGGIAIDRLQSIQRCIQSLVHAYRCREQQCRRTSCIKLKRVVAHTKICKPKTNGGCSICKQFFALCCYHAKHCNEVECLVPFCSNFKHKLSTRTAPSIKGNPKGNQTNRGFNESSN